MVLLLSTMANAYCAIQSLTNDHCVFPAGVRVLIVDQWIETGGTMRAAIQLVEKQGATVVGQWPTSIVVDQSYISLCLHLVA